VTNSDKSSHLTRLFILAFYKMSATGSSYMNITMTTCFLMVWRQECASPWMET